MYDDTRNKKWTSKLKWHVRLSGQLVYAAQARNLETETNTTKQPEITTEVNALVYAL